MKSKSMTRIVLTLVVGAGILGWQYWQKRKAERAAHPQATEARDTAGSTRGSGAPELAPTRGDETRNSPAGRASEPRPSSRTTSPTPRTTTGGPPPLATGAPSLDGGGAASRTRASRAEVPRTPPRTEQAAGDGGASIVADAYRKKKSDVILEGHGEVTKLLADDLVGDRHQKWIVKFSNGQTVLFAHNIDVAPRVPLREGDTVQFRGEYEYNDRGGVIHWTHRDNRNRPGRGGWIIHDSKKYE